MEKTYRDFYDSVETEPLISQIEELCKIEQGQTFESYHKAAEYTLALLKKNNIPNAEIIEFPADGKTVYQDKRMPLAWEASVGKLTVDKCPADCQGELENFRVLADFQQESFSLIKGSVWQPGKNHSIRVITEQQFLAGEDPKDALVMLEPFTWPRAHVLTPVLDQGGLGIISDFLIGRYFDQDCLQWVNACSESNDWHVTAEDRPFIGFSVSPRKGDFIRRAANAGALTVKVECDGRRYEGTLPVVTALIPGKSERELWVYAHLYEPLLDDDSCGIVSSIAVGKYLMEKCQLNCSIRLLFAMELYGFAAYAAYRGDELKEQAIGGFNLDTLPLLKGSGMCVCPAGPAKPFIGNRFMREACEKFKGTQDITLNAPAYFDDLFIGDPTVGVPSGWFLAHNGGMWHNSRQCRIDMMDKKLYRKSLAFATAVIAETAAYDGPEVPREKFDAVKVSSPWRDYAEKMIFARRTAGFPHSLVNAAPEKRIALPDGVLYGPFANVLCNMDGRKSLSCLISEAEAETGRKLSESDVKKHVDAINFLADNGYLEPVSRPELTADDIRNALKELGVMPDDLLAVHGSLSKCGYISGGAKSVVETIIETAGNAMFTTFTRPYIYLGGLNRDWKACPYDGANVNQVRTGELGKCALQIPGVRRSRHITHSWAGFGSKGHQCVALHGETDSPVGELSPLAQALKLKGKILFFGCGLAPTTYLHRLEDICSLPYLDVALCRMKCEDGSIRTVSIEKHLPGHRDFYRPDAENSKFYQRAFARGLQVKSVTLGMAKIQLVEIEELHRIGLELLKEDPRVLLCDDPDCVFCRKF